MIAVKELVNHGSLHLDPRGMDNWACRRLPPLRHPCARMERARRAATNHPEQAKQPPSYGAESATDLRDTRCEQEQCILYVGFRRQDSCEWHHFSRIHDRRELRLANLRGYF